MIRTVDQLIADFRRDVFDHGTVDEDSDVVVDYLWSDDDVLRYINQACAQLASDTLALRRRFTLSVASGQALVRFPYDEIIDGLQVSFAVPGVGRRRVLHQFNMEEGIYVDDYGLEIYAIPDYDAVGFPTHYSRDFDNSFLRLWRVPDVAGTLEAYAIVLPSELYPGMPLPFSAMQDLHLLMLWIKHLAYAKQDADTLDLQRSNDFAAQYRAMALDRRSEIDRIRRDGGVMRPR